MGTRVLTGQFNDGPFIGLDFQTPSQKGVTDNEGKFLYQEGEDVSFSIGRLVIGIAKGFPSLTLASLHDSVTDVEVNLHLPETINRARFVQSLGQEADLHSGVLIDKTLRDVVNANADGILFTSDVKTFEQASSVSVIFKQLGRRFRGAAEARNHTRRGLLGIKAIRNVRVPLRDGSYLLADVFRPLKDGTYPVLLRLSIYGRAFTIGSVHTEADHIASEEREAAWYEKDRSSINHYFRYSETGVSANSSSWVPRGYVLVRVDGRGVGQSPGKLDPFSKQEAEDYFDTIQWAAGQPWSTGHIGLYGGSYNATIQWNVAALQPPALKAIAPLACDADAYRDLAYQGGILLENYRQWWFNETVRPAKNPESDAVNFVGGLHNHQWDDEHYHGKALLSADFSRINIPVITSVSQTSWIHSRAGIEAFTQIPSKSKRLLIWDAAYTSYMYEDSKRDLEEFFDEHLKGIKPAQQSPAVRMIIRTGDGGVEWRDSDTWPLKGTEYRKLFLDANGANSRGHLSSIPPKNKGVVEYSANADGPLEDLPLAVFDSEPLKDDLNLAGHFRARLWLSSSSTDADVFVAVRVFDGDREVPYRTREPSSEAPLTWGVLKASHRALDLKLSTTERPWHAHHQENALPLTPNEAVPMEVELMPATARIRAGHRLRIEISPAEGRGRIPGFERAYDESYHKGAVNRVFTGDVYVSSITIPVVPR
ncbi:Alpha/Beta hydrolase protein [Xylogone sp. PMI_703]|nr:Alpha/Beta hydrolase protein [Xylogone sp. PMI_703]